MGHLLAYKISPLELKQEQTVDMGIPFPCNSAAGVLVHVSALGQVPRSRSCRELTINTYLYCKMTLNFVSLFKGNLYTKYTQISTFQIRMKISKNFHTVKS